MNPYGLYVANLVNSTILTNICYNISRFIRGVIMTREELEKYPFELSKLSEEDGGGYLISYTDFNDCDHQKMLLDPSLISYINGKGNDHK